MADFEKAIKKVLKHEGGYIFHPADPGGETNFGITDRLDGSVDGLIDVDGNGSGDVTVKALKESDAKVIYKREFWDKMQGDRISNQQVAEIIFDGYVNMGARAIMILQRELGLQDDGKFGQKTLEMVNKISGEIVFNNFKAARLEFYRDLAAAKPKLAIFLRGWTNRINSFKYVA
jgi:lysozyme family protein